MGFLARYAAYLRDYAWVAAGGGLAGFLSLAVFIMLARNLPEADLGAFSLFFAVMIIVWQIPGFLDSAFVRYARVSDPPRAVSFLKVNLVLKAGSTGLLLAVAPVFGLLLARFVFHGKVTPALIAAGAACGAFLSMYASVVAHFQSRERFFLYAVGNFAFYALNLAVLGLIFLAGRDVSASSTARVFTVTALLIGIASWGVLYRKARPLLPLPREEAKTTVLFGRWVFMTSVFYLLMQRIDVLFVGRFFSLDDTGVYAVASRLVAALSLLISAAAALFLPKAGAAAAASAAERTLKPLKIYARDAAVLIGLVAVAAGLLILGVPLLIDVLFGAGFAPAVLPARLLLASHIPLALYLPFGYLLYGFEDSFSNSLAMALGLLVNVLVNLTVTPRVGLTGPAAAFAAGYTVLFLTAAAAVAFRLRNRAIPGAPVRDGAGP